MTDIKLGEQNRGSPLIGRKGSCLSLEKTKPPMTCQSRSKANLIYNLDKKGSN